MPMCVSGRVTKSDRSLNITTPLYQSSHFITPSLLYRAGEVQGFEPDTSLSEARSFSPNPLSMSLSKALLVPLTLLPKPQQAPRSPPMQSSVLTASTCVHLLCSAEATPHGRTRTRISRFSSSLCITQRSRGPVLPASQSAV